MNVGCITHADVHFGFSNASVSVVEGEGVVSLVIGVRGGTVTEPFQVQVFTSDGSAEGIYYVISYDFHICSLLSLPRIVLSVLCRFLSLRLSLFVLFSESLDYTPINDVYTFTLLNQQVKIEVPIIKDTTLEDDESFLVEFVFLNDTVPVLTAGFQANVTIIDDDGMSTFKK